MTKYTKSYKIWQVSVDHGSTQACQIWRRSVYGCEYKSPKINFQLQLFLHGYVWLCFKQKNTWSRFASIVHEICKLILKKIINIVAITCHILKLKCTKFDFGWRSAPVPAREAYSANPNPLLDLNSLLLR